MARSEIRRLYDNGMISRRALSSYRGLCGPDEINDQAYQSDAAGFGKTQDFGPDDAGHIDAKANRRAFPKESVVRASNRPSGTSPRAARMQPSYNMYDVPGRN